MIQTVLDTNVLISATFWNGPSYEITRSAIQQKITCFTSIEILDEYGRILKREFDQSPDQTEEKIQKIMQFSKVIEPKTRVKAVKEDPDDDKIIEAAIEANADYIISGNKHLLKLKEFQGIQIIKPAEFMKMIK